MSARVTGRDEHTQGVCVCPCACLHECVWMCVCVCVLQAGLASPSSHAAQKHGSGPPVLSA